MSLHETPSPLVPVVPSPSADDSNVDVLFDYGDEYATEAHESDYPMRPSSYSRYPERRRRLTIAQQLLFLGLGSAVSGAIAAAGFRGYQKTNSALWGGFWFGAAGFAFAGTSIILRDHLLSTRR